MSSNFTFLEAKYPLLANLGQLAENNLYTDPNTTLTKVRLFAEQTVKIIFDVLGIPIPIDNTQNARLYVLKNEDIVPQMILDILYTIKKVGNKAVHENTGTVAEAKTLLSLSFKLGQWFMTVYGKENVSSLTFVMPENVDTTSKIKSLEKEFHEIQEKYRKLSEERTAPPVPPTAQEIRDIRAESIRATDKLRLNEAETRKIIDEKLRQAGWEADSINLRFEKGTRPVKVRNLAIAEWPVGNKYADYALFIGTNLVAIIEAKRLSKDVPSDIEQAKIYSRLAEPINGAELKGKWNDYKVPFMFATNGRPYLKQIENKSGIWLLDGRKPTNHPRALQAWYSPQGLTELLEKDEEEANQKLKNETFDYLKDKAGLGLRDYQILAISKIEEGIQNSRREILTALATGTGKTRLIIGLIYRLLKTKRFKRILFLVDRSTLGIQAADAFKDATIEDLLTFTQTYDIKELRERKPDINTKVHFATVQGMVKRIFYNEDESVIPAVDAYDCIVVDEAHRGYILDKEMSDDELSFKNQDDYVGKYRRVLDYFDSVKIGLTATPATHTVEIFGNPVYNYTYREAVIDGYLIDHEPPVIIETELKKEGIKWQVGEIVKGYDSRTGRIEELDPLDDEVNIEVDNFNTKVITENFNRTVIRELVKHLDPESKGKTLIFTATNDHADLVVRMLKEEFEEMGNPVHDDSIKKITGTIYDPQQAIRMFKNERYPNIVVTVDLLTTGVDVPEICNIVFIRRVKSRILYEQMLGRATRRADHINKDHFKIFDSVGIYEMLKDFTDMKPIVTRPQTDFKTLIDDLDKTEPGIKQSQVDEIIAKLQRKKRSIKGDNSELFSTRADGRTPDEFIKWIRDLPPDTAASELKQRRNLFMFLDEMKGEAIYQLISEHEDRLLNVSRGYGMGKKPEDYIGSFRHFIQNNMNIIPALQIVCQRPKELTRQALKELKYELDKEGYSETNLNIAWKELKNEDIAADIISFIRQQALGCALISHEDRIRNAIRKVKRLRQWTVIQEKWLDRIEKQLVMENIIDRESFNRDPFVSFGGYEQINKVFNRELDNVIMLINDNLYAVS